MQCITPQYILTARDLLHTCARVDHTLSGCERTPWQLAVPQRTQRQSVMFGSIYASGAHPGGHF
jgi:hypothetical protein